MEPALGNVPIDHADASLLLQELRDGDLTHLEFDAIVYRHVPNKNHTLFRDQDLDEFAASFTGQPFLRNHNTGDISDRDGTITNSRLDEERNIRQTISLTTRRGINDYLEGIIDRFSIGWYFDSIECTVCHRDFLQCDHWPGNVYIKNGEEKTCQVLFIKPFGKETSAVNAPAVPGTHIIDQLAMLKENQFIMPAQEEVAVLDTEETTETVYPQKDETLIVNPAPATAGQPAPNTAEVEAELTRLRQELHEHRISQLVLTSNLMPESKNAVMLGAKGKTVEEVAELIEAQKGAEAAHIDRQIVKGVRPIVAGDMSTPLDRLTDAVHWIFGSKDVPVPSPNLRDIRDIYQAITGDVNWYGKYNPEWSQLALGNTTTLPSIVVDALNKVIIEHYNNLVTYRWYEQLVNVVPHTGTTHDVNLLHVDGIANLPTVAEGAAYTEATVGDSKETMTFAKKGHYVGITLEAIRRSDIQRIQAIPRELVKGAVRTRSASISSIFTDNTGTGPTMGDDSTVLFHSDHANIATAALSFTEWTNARTRIWEQTMPGTSKPLGLWPSFLIVPIELYDTGLNLFGYGAGPGGQPGTANQDVNPYGESRIGDPRPTVVPAPDWTDANNWAYMVDPRLQPTIHMAYANAPQGNNHPMPEIYEVTSETSGLMFSNDTLPIKVRDWFAYGAGTHVGIGKNNVS